MFGLWLIYDLIKWKYKAKFEQWKMDRLAEKMYKDLKKAEIVADLNRYKLGLATSQQNKAYQTKEIPQNVGLAMHVREWHVYNKNQKAIDVEFEVLEN
jgi:hypothetical protein